MPAINAGHFLYLVDGVEAIFGFLEELTVLLEDVVGKERIPSR
jgi:hypothetical protein